jgi:hypothetical protein
LEIRDGAPSINVTEDGTSRAVVDLANQFFHLKTETSTRSSEYSSTVTLLPEQTLTFVVSGYFRTFAAVRQ